MKTHTNYQVFFYFIFKKADNNTKNSIAISEGVRLPYPYKPLVNNFERHVESVSTSTFGLLGKEKKLVISRMDKQLYKTEIVASLNPFPTKDSFWVCAEKNDLCVLVLDIIYSLE